MMSGGLQSRPETTLLTDRATRYLEKGPADVVELIGHICNLPAAPRIVAEHMARAMFAGRPEFICDPQGRWTLTALPPTFDGGAGERPRGRGRGPGVYAQYGAPARQHYDRAAAARMGAQSLAGLSYVVVDVETTGGRPPHDRITEIAAVVVRDGQVKEVFETLVNPLRPIPPIVTRITNICWDMVKDAPTFAAIAGDVERALVGNVFVAHNATFDWKFVTHEISRASGARLLGRRLCTVRLARQLLPQLPRRSLDYVAGYYGVEIRARHRAGGDAVATAQCLIRLLDDAAQRGCTTWDDLDVLLGHRTPRKRRKRRALPTSVDRDTTA